MKDSLVSICVNRHLSILSDEGIKLSPQARILDFGCGKGEVVVEYRRRGFNSFGCDIEIPEDIIKLVGDDILRKIDLNNYKIPFEDEYFDFIYSNQVFEHVQNYELACSEMERVLKDGGCCLHVFPSKLKLIEPHIMVPLAGVIQKRWWLAIWAFLGIKNEFQKGASWLEVLCRNYKYLHTKTNYLNKRQIHEVFARHFGRVEFCELLFLKYHGGRASFLYPLARSLNFIASMYSTFRMRCIFLCK